MSAVSRSSSTRRGVHLPFHGDLPTCAMDTGADVCVVSIHTREADRLVASLESLARAASGFDRRLKMYLPSPDELQLESVMSPREAFFGRATRLGRDRVSAKRSRCRDGDTWRRRRNSSTHSRGIYALMSVIREPARCFATTECVSCCAVSTRRCSWCQQEQRP